MVYYYFRKTRGVCPVKKQLARGFLWVTLFVVALRCYLVFFKIDPKTGFYEQAGLLPILFVLVLAVVNIRITVRWLGVPRSSPPLPFKGSIALGMTAILLGLAVAFSSYEGFYEIFQKNALDRPISLFEELTVIFGVFAAVVFLLQGICFFRRGKGQPGTYLLTLPVLWLLTMVVSRFAGYTDIRTISEQQLFIAVLLCSLLFLTGQVGFITGIKPNLLDRMVVFGSITGMLGLTLAIPRMLAALFGKNPLLGILRPSDLWVVLLMGLYGIFFAWESARESTKKLMWPRI